MSYMERNPISGLSRDHKDFFPDFSAIEGFGRAASTNKASSSGFIFPLNTLGSYRVTEIPVELAARVLKEWERLFTSTHAAADVTFGDKLAAIRVRDWSSHTRLGYEVEEFDVECLATQSGGETINKSADVAARIDRETSCGGKAIG